MLCNYNKIKDNLLLKSKSRRERIRLYRKKKNNLYHSSLEPGDNEDTTIYWDIQ